jgi:hypothetical protein
MTKLWVVDGDRKRDMGCCCFCFRSLFCFLVGYERNEFLLLTTLAICLLGELFVVCFCCCNGFGWTLVKEGVGVGDKYQELFRWKQLSIF